ncbi:MAG: hypothetical protein ACR2MG_17305 [Pyrinomonadaceae bacterium]
MKRFDRIEWAFEFLEERTDESLEVRTEILKYISIGMVACLESYYRMVIRDLIDYGSPYNSNAHNLESGRIDLNVVLGLGREKISIGEFISHLIPISSFEDINRNLSIIIDKDFLSELKNVKNDELNETIEEFAGELFEDVKEIFRYRHIFCHELATKVKPKLKEQGLLIGAALIFAYTTELMIEDMIGKKTV